MPRDAFIRTRTDSYLKEQAEAVFVRLGINMTDAINLFLAQVALRSALPFDVSIPETDTEFYERREAAVRDRIQSLNDAIEEGAEDLRQNRYVTASQFQAQLREHVESVKFRRKPV
jgi:DNA-damage-inducible protein J